ncbi:MAG: group 1 truncated hemoglobin [Pseudomonadota bacterium]
MAQTMFERYGGFGHVSKIVMAFYDRLIDSDVVGHYFEDVDLKRLIDHQTKFVATAMGGPASYSNEMLERSHAHLAITGEEFQEMAAIMGQTLEDFEVAPDDVRHVVDQLRARMPYIVKTKP